MSESIEPEEVQAILDAVDTGGSVVPAEVQPRNFRQPRRLSRERLQYLASLVNASLQGVCRDIASPLRHFHKLTLASVSEVNVLGLFQGYEPPFLVDVLECGGHVTWILWDSAAATASVETVLSGPPVEVVPEEGEEGEAAPEVQLPAIPEARRLSQSECRVIEALLNKILVPVAGALGLEISGGRIAQEPEELTSLEDCGPDSDARRLMLHFLFEGPGGPSDLRIYLPDVGEEDALAESGAGATPLPGHLQLVRLDVSAYLASVDVSLQELMSLEVGDVIPLGVEAGSPIQLFIEDRPCAKATWGRAGAQQAVLIRSIETTGSPIEEPGD